MVAQATKKTNAALLKEAARPWMEFERSIWRRPPYKKVSKWADDRRRVTEGPEPGPWRTSRVPYLRDPMDAYTDPDVREITITGPGQCAKTAAVENMIGYSIDCEPMSSLYMSNTDDNVKYISEKRIRPMCDDSPALAEHLTGRPWDMEKGKEFNFDRMTLYFGSSQSLGSLISKSIGRAFCDELDNWRAYIGAQGSPAQMVKRRGETYDDFKVVWLCTPTTETGFINTSYERSLKHRYMVPCPRCGKYIRLRFGNLKVDPADRRDADLIRLEESVYYECQKCGGRIEEYERADMVAVGVWVPAGLTIDPKGKYLLFDSAGGRVWAKGKPEKSRRHVGYWIGELISPWVSWHDLLADWFEKNTPEGIAQGILREFINQGLGWLWKERAQSHEKSELEKRIGDYDRGTVPDDAVILVAGADYHEDEQGIGRWDYVITAWGYSMRCWIVNQGSVNTDVELENELFRTPFPWSNPDKLNDPYLEVELAACDSGYKSQHVYEFCDRWPYRAVPTKGGHDTQGMTLTITKRNPKTKTRKTSKLIRPGCLYTFRPISFKDKAASRLSAGIGAAGSCTFFVGAGGRYFTQLCNEHRVETIDQKTGKPVYHWEPVAKGRPVHFWDCQVAGEVAAYLKNVHTFRPDKPRGTRVKLSEKLRRKREGR